jgi:small-conductance mechanosensitive channel
VAYDNNEKKIESIYSKRIRAATATAILKAVVMYSAVSALIFAVLAPRAPQWRLVWLADGPTRRVAVLLCAITATYAIDAALTETSRVFFVPLALTVVQSFVASTAFALRWPSACASAG